MGLNLAMSFSVVGKTFLGNRYFGVLKRPLKNLKYLYILLKTNLNNKQNIYRLTTHIGINSWYILCSGSASASQS
jgi:hypothetical protein